ncbi:MAG: nucleoside hydrolase [Candidatus Hydrogenedentota bacterium]
MCKESMRVFRHVRWCWIVLAAFLLAAPGSPAQAEEDRTPIPIILDTDMESDVDDVGALAMLHAFADRGEAEALGVVVSAKNPYATLTADRINTYFGRPDLPLGQLKGEGVDRNSRYAQQVAEEFPGQLESAGDAPDAVEVYREILAGQPDDSVVIVTIGYKTNVRDLLFSEPCEHSDLDGRELVDRKVRLWVCMGGHFPEGREANIRWDAQASAEAIDAWPTEIIFSGWEIGRPIMTAGELHELPEDSPVRRSYELFNDLQPHHSWDQAALLYAVRGLDDGPAADYWELSDPGRIVIDPEDGGNTWEADPEGTHRHKLERRDPDFIADELDELMMHVPGNGGE